MKKTIIVSILLLFCLSNYAVSKKDLEKVTAIIEKVEKYYEKYPKLKGYFSLYINEIEQRGYFIFSSPSYLKLFFGPENPDEKEKYKYIITNGNTLWIYLPAYKVLVEQEIPDYYKQIGMLGIGISRFLANYKELVLKEEYKNNEKLNVLTLKKPEKNVPYQELSFYINKEGFITILKGKTIKNNIVQWISFYRYNIKKNPEITEKDFEIKPSGDIQILRNVLIKTKR